MQAEVAVVNPLLFKHNPTTGQAPNSSEPTTIQARNSSEPTTGKPTTSIQV